MSQNNEITAEKIEFTFSQTNSGARFTGFCNAIIAAESTSAATALPILSEKPGADGAFDGELNLPSHSARLVGNPFLRGGWNLFQFKARGISGGGRRKAISSLKSSLGGAIGSLIKRLKRQRKPTNFVVFTNLQLGLKNVSTASDAKLLSRDREIIELAIRKDYKPKVSVQIVDAAQLAALVNKHPTLRLTFFSDSVARTWDEKWTEEQRVKDYKISVPLIGRESEIATLANLINDATTKIIAISGPSGMGKSRVALESTQIHRHRTTVVDDVKEFQQWKLESLNKAATPRLIIVEDPDEAQAEQLVKKAIASEGIKLILTFPSEADTPVLKLTDHEALKKISLRPLTSAQSKELLSKAGATLDHVALDWVILQAGGNPEILLSAANLGALLREKSGSLKSNLASIYQQRIERKLDREAFLVVRMISLLQWVNIAGEPNDLIDLTEAFGLQLPHAKIKDHLKRLERLGYVRRRGDHVMLVPPLFAAALVEEIFTTELNTVCTAFDRLEITAKKRLLERVVTTDLKEGSKFWDHVFIKTFGSVSHLIANSDFLDYLARAVPGRTVQFLAERINALGERAKELVPILRELAYQSESCVTSVRLLQHLALQEPWEKQVYNDHAATQIFSECFVHWYFSFPLSFQDRERWVRDLLGSGDVVKQRLAIRVVVMVTQPPSSLSSYTANARRLGTLPPNRLWREVHDYLNHFVELRFELTQVNDEAVVKYANNGFIGALQQMRLYLPPDDSMNHLERLMNWANNGKLEIDVSELRGAIKWLEDDYRKNAAKPEQAPYVERWNAVLQRIEALRGHLDNGSFLVRLKLALGNEWDYESEEIAGKRLYGFEKRCRLMAEEAIANSALMTDEAWAAVFAQNASQAHNFVLCLGQLDHRRVFYEYFLKRVGDPVGDHYFGLYLRGAQNSHAVFVEERLDGLMRSEQLAKNAMLKAISLVGATPGNRARLQKLIQDKSVQPVEIANMFTAGRWLEHVPVDEIRVILNFIATGPKGWSALIVEIVSLHLGVVKILPRELVTICVTALEQFDSFDRNDDWAWERVAIGVARADLDQAFKMVTTRIQSWAATTSVVDKETQRGLFNRRMGREFWTFLCVNHPERTFRELLAIREAITKLDGFLSFPFDLQKHSSVLLSMTTGDEAAALFLLSGLSGAQKGYFLFAYSLMNAHKNCVKIHQDLMSRAVYQTGNGVEWSYAQALDTIESELASSGTPPQHIKWLKQIKLRIQQAPKPFSYTGEGYEFLGWE